MKQAYHDAIIDHQTGHAPASSLMAFTLEGGLFAPDFLQKIAHGQATHQRAEDYQLLRGLTLRDEISRYWKVARQYWLDFVRQREKKAQRSTPIPPSEACRVTVDYFLMPFCKNVLGLQITPVGTIIEDDTRRFPIGWMAQAGRVPLVFAPYTHALDKAEEAYRDHNRRRSPFLLAQEFLNYQPATACWALVSNGLRLRLVHPNLSLTRPVYLEINLEMIFEEDRYADFSALWLLLHASRFGMPPAAPTACPLTAWQQASAQEGLRARERLREGVTEALRTLGTGFLTHPANQALRVLVRRDQAALHAYFEQLLRLIYRLIFLVTIEDRGLIFTPEATPVEQARYWAGYSLTHLRQRALQFRGEEAHHDLWQLVQITFRGLGRGEPALGLPALGGLFAPSQCPDLDTAELHNAVLRRALLALCFFQDGTVRSRVNYKDMDSEELGSVYESLLELVPQLTISQGDRFGFVGDQAGEQNKGHARKLTGSYYTPDSLVQALIESALDPVIEQACAADQPETALLALTVCDPACGSGHFLLAAARRIAHALAQVRTPDSVPTDETFRHALRDVIAHCLYGVDKNPMAVELARTALWLEAYTPDRPLTFLDHHLLCGDALLGWLSLATLPVGLDKAAYKALTGDDKTVCKNLVKTNQIGCKELAKNLHGLQTTMAFNTTLACEQFEQLEALPTDTPAEIHAKAAAHAALLQQTQHSLLQQLADIQVGVYLLPKTPASAPLIPTTALLYHLLIGDPLTDAEKAMVAAVQAVCRQAQVLHWPLAFPTIFAQGGFDCVLGNPPWEVSQLSEEEFFAAYSSTIADLAGEKRKRAIAQLEKDHPYLWEEFNRAAQQVAAKNNFYKASQRFTLTAVGKLNTYSLFSELISQITSPRGRAGFIVPSGIATDDSTKAYFAQLVQKKQLVSLFDFENRQGIFPAVHKSYKFCLITLGLKEKAQFIFFATEVEQLSDTRRHFTLTADEFRLLNPNTLTCPIFRAVYDARLTKKIYQHVPVLLAENEPHGNPWGISFSQGLFNMTSDSHLFYDTPAEAPPAAAPLYEAKMIHQFDHRWATYDEKGQTHDVTLAQKQDPHYTVTPRYWVDHQEVTSRLANKGWHRDWLMGWRKICRATDERTVIASIFPKIGTGNSLPLAFPDYDTFGKKIAGLVANQCSLIYDYIARLKLGGSNMDYFVYKQLPILPPDRYTEADLNFIVPRVLELTYTTTTLAAWAADLGYTGAPFAFDPERRAQCRAELDAYYARLYGLCREELCYILDPASVMGADYPSETFRVLKNNELKQYGEYRTARLVLAAWDALAGGTH